MRRDDPRITIEVLDGEELIFLTEDGWRQLEADGELGGLSAPSSDLQRMMQYDLARCRRYKEFDIALYRPGTSKRWLWRLLLRTPDGPVRVLTQRIHCWRGDWQGTGACPFNAELFRNVPDEKSAWARAEKQPLAGCPRCGGSLSSHIIWTEPLPDEELRALPAPRPSAIGKRDPRINRQMLDGQEILIPSEEAWEIIKREQEIDGIKTFPLHIQGTFAGLREQVRRLPGLALALCLWDTYWQTVMLLRSLYGWIRVFVRDLDCPHCDWHGLTACTVFPTLYVRVPDAETAKARAARLPAAGCPRCGGALAPNIVATEPDLGTLPPRQRGILIPR